MSSAYAQNPEVGDAVLYFISVIFAVITITASGITLYQQWGKLAVGPLAAGGVASLVLAYVVRRRRGRSGTTGAASIAAAATAPTAATSPKVEPRLPRWRWTARIIIATCVFAGATAIPLGLEVLWRSDGDPGSHVQPEVLTIERGGQAVAKGKDPYHEVTTPDHKVIYHPKGQPLYEGFLPYLPLMTVFGLPSDRHHDVVLTDARIFFSLVTLIVTACALWLCPAGGRRKMRAMQVLAILPTAALPLATGGDDMPVAAFLLLAMVLAQRRQPFASGLVLGIVSSMKFTAWPLAALALFAARGKHDVRRPGTMFLGMLVVAGPVVVPFALRGPWAFFDNVVLFPLGLSGVTSPAASPLPGHLIVAAFPFLHRALPLGVGLVGGFLLGLHLWRRPPQTVAQVCTVGGVVMSVIILLAPATRIGYLLYPINFFVWAYLFAELEPQPKSRWADEPSIVVADGGGTAPPLLAFSR
ncbi:MAG TPA: glycosyltransferase 87 family protein [Acidimicrobiales bacterium]